MKRVVGGFPVGADGRVHGTFSNNPSTLRFSMHDPNLQNIPRGNDSEIGKWVKDMFVAPPGWVFCEADFAGIEAKLVGYFAGSARYTRAAGLGVHAFFASHLVGEPASWDWSDADLLAFFKALKRSHPIIYDTAKRCVHGSNYMMTPQKMNYEYPETFKTIKDAARTQGFYFELFPEIRVWHRELCDRVDGTKKRKVVEGEMVDPWTLGICHARNPFGYVHRFYNVLNWERVQTEGDKWEWMSSYGEDAKRLVAFLPQSTAAAILKRAMRRLWYEFPWIGVMMRLVIHDSIICEVRETEVEECQRILRLVMEAPIPELPLDPRWGMGEFLTVGVETKTGQVWSQMS